MSEELINKEELLKKAKCNAYNCYYGTEEDCPHCEHMVVRYSDIDNSPTVEERKHGHWEWYEEWGFDGEIKECDEAGFRCSKCKNVPSEKLYYDDPYDTPDFEYCPHCGAIMDEVIEE